MPLLARYGHPIANGTPGRSVAMYLRSVTGPWHAARHPLDNLFTLVFGEEKRFLKCDELSVRTHELIMLRHAFRGTSSSGAWFLPCQSGCEASHGSTILSPTEVLP